MACSPLTQMAFSLLIVSISFIAGSTGSAVAEDPAGGWARFHGEGGLGVVAEGFIPDRWDRGDYLWSFPLGGTDVGSPVIAHGRVYLTDTSSEAGTVDLVAIELATGAEVWRYRHPLKDRPRHARNSPASTTPAADEQHIYFAHGDAAGAAIMAIDRKGALVWHRDLGSWQGEHGFSASPIVIDDQVILFNEQQADELDPGLVPGQSQMMAFDRMSGASTWTTPLKTTRVCYGVPALHDPEGDMRPRHVIAANTGNGLFGLDELTGEMLWSLKLFDKRCCSSPIVIDGLAIASCGSGGGGNSLSVVQIPEEENEEPKELFRMERAAPYVPSPVVHDGLLFCVSDNGIASCVDLQQDGKILWSERLGGNFSASVLLIGDKLLAVSLDGEVAVFSATRSFQLLSKFDLGGTVGSTPAYGNHRLILRVGNQLHCLETQRSS